MALVHIAELHPKLAARESKQFKAAVTLIWPYSSSQRQFALLLAEPEFRLRRKKGQVRARFSGSSAKALATTGVGIGDEVVLSLRGGQFVKEGTVSTPGRSIDWELEYTQTVVVQVFRDGSEIANLDLLDAAPTPAPRSPVRRETATAPSPAPLWSSPAFLKRVRLSDGPFFEAPYDPLADENADGHDKKRRRKSYRDWKAWTYSARTPSPEKGDADVDEELAHIDASPSRPTQLPDSPVSPPKPDVLSVAGSLDTRHDTSVEEAVHGRGLKANIDEARAGSTEKLGRESKTDDFVRDEDYYDLYAGPDELPPEDSQFAFGGDTEANTEEEDSLEQTDGSSLSATEVNTEDLEGDNSIESGENQDETRHHAEDRFYASVPASDVGSLGRVEETPLIVMPPPTLPALDTSFFTTNTVPGLLTPIGKEPASPTLQPLDSALLPLPSPFPGERDSNASSYLDHVSTDRESTKPVSAEDEDRPSDVDYIEENSFFSSIGSSRNPAMHPDHESAFTPVRFTFGMDGAGFSRPLELSSPPPEITMPDVIPKDHPQDDVDSRLPSSVPPTEVQPSNVHIAVDQPPENNQPDLEQAVPEVIELSSDSETEDADELEAGELPGQDKTTSDGVAVEQDVHDTSNSTTIHDAPGEEGILLTSQIPPATDDDQLKSTNQSGVVSEVVDLGSPNNSDLDEQTTKYEDDKAGEDDTTDKYAIAEADRTMSDVPLVPQNNDATIPTSPGSYSELATMDFAPSFSDLIADTHDMPAAHTSNPQELDQPLGRRNDNMPVVLDDDIEPFIVPQDSDMHALNDPLGDSHDISQWIPEDMEDLHPDIKMESIEESSVFQISGQDSQADHEASTENATGSRDKLLIDVPEDGHKVGELHTIAVPATGPARNTRSKTKPSVSPTKEEHTISKRTTRSTRSKASITPAARTTLSPARTRTRSTMSPQRDTTQTSPYSLRSQSKLLSPTDTTFSATATMRRSPRKHASQRSVDSISDAGTNQPGKTDPLMASFEPSQEPGASQGRYSNVSLVKDSEEESLHSENSLSTVKYSDEWNMFTNLSDPMVPNEQAAATSNMEPPPATAPEQGSWLGPKTKWNKSVQVVDQTKSSPTQPNFPSTTQPPPSSPNRRHRATNSVEALSSSPRITRTTRRHVYTVTSSPPRSVDEAEDETTPKAGQLMHEVAYPALPGEGDGYETRSSPPAPFDIGELMHSSPPASTPAFPSVNQQSYMDSNTLMTPEATQQSNMEFQNSVNTGERVQTLPMTPQLTQATSDGLQSFDTSMQNGKTDLGTHVKEPQSSLIKSTPRRNATEVDVASPSSSTNEHSPNNSDIEASKPHSPDLSSDTLDTKPEPPSIGLSTPLAYYTPLNSLTFFLNRSSQFHTASKPDILALVTSSTVPAQRATKGRKDWTTSLHITDFSSYPATTTVNIFRAYQTALPVAETGDIILLRAFAVKSLNRHPILTSADDSSWCVWRYKKPVWGAKKVPFGEMQAREEVKGPVVERGEGEWKEVERLRAWYLGGVKRELEEKEEGKRLTRSQDKGNTGNELRGDGEVNGSQRVTRSKDVGSEA
ncbi:hypothetical protein BKA63DRAFT_517599 [Paraphoma chrysanthemicola]|nr:hypothetical protein BKA63DRAFT_517599 [Paraphoma chrysanthemicola]